MKATLRSESPESLSTHSSEGLATDRRATAVVRPLSVVNVLCPAEPRSTDSLFVGSVTPCQICLRRSRCLPLTDVTSLTLIEVHVNYAWRSREDVAYPRHETGRTVRLTRIVRSCQRLSSRDRT
jgi:hypothetical protein